MIHANTKRAHGFTYASVVNLYVGEKTGSLSPPVHRSIIKYVKLQVSGETLHVAVLIYMESKPA